MWRLEEDLQGRRDASQGMEDSVNPPHFEAGAMRRNLGDRASRDRVTGADVREGGMGAGEGTLHAGASAQDDRVAASHGQGASQHGNGDEDDEGVESEGEGDVEMTSGPQGGGDEGETRDGMVARMNFDLSLASSHTYLGQGEDAEGTAAIFPEGCWLDSLPLMQCSDIVLFPGQTLPLTLTQQDWAAICLALPAPPARKIIGIVGHRLSRSRDFTGMLGTIAEVRSNAAAGTGISLVTLGRQRFVVESSRQRTWSISDGCVQVLEEPRPPRVPTGVMGVGPVGARRHSLAARCITGGGGGAFWGSGVWGMFDAKRLRKVANALFLGILGLPGDTAGRSYTSPEDPVAFSYWLACQLMVGQATRQMLLELPGCVDRLRMEIALLKRMGVMRCRRCRFEICSHRQAFSMSADGPVSAYVNPGGVVHETATYYKAKNIVLIGAPSTEHSWYAWSIGICGQCGSHLGWRFDCEREGMVPERFWGLSRSNLCASRAAGWVNGGQEEVGSGREDDDSLGSPGEEEEEEEGSDEGW